MIPVSRRRAFVVAGGAFAACAAGVTAVAVGGHLPTGPVPPRVARVGYLNSISDTVTPNLDAFRQGMRDSGWIEGQNLIIDIRWTEDRPERYPSLAAELVALQPDAIVCGQVAGVQAVMHLSDTLPIVMANVNDPVGSGLIASLARPGGHVTGAIQAGSGGLGAKRFDLIKAIVPGLSRVAVVFDTENPSGGNDFQEIQDAALQSGVEVMAVGVASPDDLAGVLNSVLVSRPQALLTAGGGAIILGRRPEMVDFANNHRLPLISGTGWADAGAVAAYGPDTAKLYNRAAYYVDRILHGARPADLPVEQPTTFSLVVNQTTARALGITIPPEVAVQVTDWVQ